MKETKNKSCPVVFLNRFLSTSQTKKHDIQDWLDNIKLGLHITIVGSVCNSDRFAYRSITLDIFSEKGQY